MKPNTTVNTNPRKLTIELTREQATFFLNTIVAYNTLVPTDKLLQLDKEAGSKMFDPAATVPLDLLLVACQPIVDRL